MVPLNQPQVLVLAKVVVGTGSSLYCMNIASIAVGEGGGVSVEAGSRAAEAWSIKLMMDQRAVMIDRNIIVDCVHDFVRSLDLRWMENR